MKTIKEWLEMLNEPERSEALENTNIYLFEKVNECKDAICMAFDWDKSPQKENYWYNIYLQLKYNTYKFNHENKLHS